MKANKAAGIVAGALALALTASACSSSKADDGEFQASGTVKMVVAMAAGGGSDRAMRVMSGAINAGAEGYNTVVENREGGGGAVGWSYFYGLKGQANHLVKAETAIHTLPLQDGVDVPWTYKDFTPIAMFAEDSRMVVALPDSPYNTCSDLLNTDEVILTGVSGTFGIDGMVLEHLSEAGLNEERVPFGSTGEVVTGILGGQIDFAPVGASVANQYIASGDMKALCTMSEERYSDVETLADIPTAKEQGIDASVVIWRGVLAPPEISESAKEFWINEFKKAAETDEYKEYLKSDFLIQANLYGDEFATYLDEYDAQIQEIFG